ncbi:magnesium and cobalt transporter [Rhodovulum iodosum]|uniref:Magnesium and cobalt transporter n=1 Tax=Rhodovulum iodosum TaxID=68291 RepID=A0ABV3XWW2_9RHOB|nr:hemolysin family protein [Rhodovulum robiginosum]RSK34118.1 HlyC/CorC family transporter [Rhodovulum robiginosum]
MGDDETDGSSPAAQGAPDYEIPENRGLLGRLVAAIRAPDDGDGDETGALSPVNGAMASALPPGMINLRRMRVEDVAIPKVEIVAVPLDITRDELVQVFRDSGLTRVPVYDGTLDTPAGMIHLKDFALRYGFDGTDRAFSLKEMLRPLIYAPPSMPIGVLLQKMQTQRIHMALVIDEYGGVDGLLTIEDLIEQVIGEIEDEHDVAEGMHWTLEKPGCYLVQARAPVDEFEAEIGMKLADPEDEEEIDTLGGLVFMMIGRVPARGEVIRHEEGAEFEVVDADPRRIKRLRVRLPAARQTA